MDDRYLRIDSVAPLDTAALGRADSLLGAVATPDASHEVRQTAAAIYFGTGSRLVPSRRAPRLAADWLEKADVRPRRGRGAGDRARARGHDHRASAFPAVAERVIQGLDASREFVPQFRAALRCEDDGAATGM